MSKKYFYVWVLVLLSGLFVSVQAIYYGNNDAVDEFRSNFSDEQRKAMIAFLDKHGLHSQASMQGALTALNRADVDLLISNAVRILLNNIDIKDYPAKFGKELAWAIKRADIPEEFANALIDGVKKSNLSKDFGQAFSDGFIEAIAKNLENNQAMAKLTKSFNKAVKQMGDDTSAHVDAAIGKDSKLGKKTEETIHYYTALIKGAYDSAVLESMIKTGVVTVVITAALYSIPFAIRTVERNMNRPKLIIESSQLTFIEHIQALWKPVEKKPMQAMIFNPVLKKYLDDIVKIVSTSHAKIKAGKTSIKYRNLMLYGPPGTGKTMFAKELARCSGLEFACMSGSSFSKFQDGEAIEALDELFAWANRCNGLMIFIDEAEAFLSKRENMDPQSKAYQLLNNFLNYTGQRSNKFMIVFATNHKDVLDSAMYRRIDDLIEMPLPSKAQRIDALHLYKNKILMDRNHNSSKLVHAVDCLFNKAFVEKIALKTKGFSYSELEGIMNSIQTEVDILDYPSIDADLVHLVVDRFIKKYQDFTGGKYLGLIED